MNNLIIEPQMFYATVAQYQYIYMEQSVSPHFLCGSRHMSCENTTSVHERTIGHY